MKKTKYIEIYLLLIIYIFVQTILSEYIPVIFSRLINPIFFVCLTIYLFIKTNNNHGRFTKNNDYIKKMIIIVLMYIIVYFYLGFIFGYLRSPYSHKLLIVLKNMWQILIPIIGIEYVRSVVVNANNKKIPIIFITIILIIIELNLNSVIYNIQDRIKGFEYFSSVILPSVAFGLIYTYLSTKGSYKLVLAYRLIYEIIYLLTPIYPDLDWFETGILGVLVPVIIYAIFKYDFDKRKQTSRLKDMKIKPSVYIPMFIIIITFASFMVGLFKYEPLAVVSNSMTPVFYRGDVVILRKVDNKSLKKIEKYNIIIYRLDKQLIIHRVINRIERDGTIYFQTQGDANNAPDKKLVEEKQVIGVYEFSIKYIGYPSVRLNEFFNKEKPKVETK